MADVLRLYTGTFHGPVPPPPFRPPGVHTHSDTRRPTGVGAGGDGGSTAWRRPTRIAAYVAEHRTSARRAFAGLSGLHGSSDGDAVLSFIRRFCGEVDAPSDEVAAVDAALDARARARGLTNVSFPELLALVGLEEEALEEAGLMAARGAVPAAHLAAAAAAMAVSSQRHHGGRPTVGEDSSDYYHHHLHQPSSPVAAARPSAVAAGCNVDGADMQTHPLQPQTHSQLQQQLQHRVQQQPHPRPTSPVSPLSSPPPLPEAVPIASPVGSSSREDRSWLAEPATSSSPHVHFADPPEAASPLAAAAAAAASFDHEAPRGILSRDSRHSGGFDAVKVAAAAAAVVAENVEAAVTAATATAAEANDVRLAPALALVTPIDAVDGTTRTTSPR